MKAITRKQFIRYSVLPGVRPRLRELFATGFQYIPFFMALVYQAVRLLPANHPYTNPVNMGRFGIRHVIAEAANNLVLSVRNIDQLVLFVTLLLGVVIILLQLGLFAFTLLFQPAMAAVAMPTNFAGFFITPVANAPQDLAYILLDLVFGVPGIFGSCVSTTVGGGGSVACLDMNLNPVVSTTGNSIFERIGTWPFPIHVAMHQMFRVYSLGLLIVGALIACYFMIAVVAETAQTGTPFGKRFNRVWAPLRIVVAFGLLVPVGYGLNAAQYIVLYAAKFGSGFATNGWMIFNAELNGNGGFFLANPTNLISQPNVPEVGKLLEFMYTARVCAEFEQLNSEREARASGTTPISLKLPAVNPKKLLIPYVVKGARATPNALPLDWTGPATAPTYTPYSDLTNFADGSTQVKVRIGIRDPDLYSKEPGNVLPICGELTLNLVDPRDPTNANNPPEPGPSILQHYYWFAIQEMWYCEMTDCGGAWANYPRNEVIMKTSLTDPALTTRPLPTADDAYKMDVQNFYQRDLNVIMTNPAATLPWVSPIGAIAAQAAHGAWIPNRGAGLPNMNVRGWVAAGIWYNRIAELNGSITAAAMAAPTPSRWPRVQEHVYQENLKEGRTVSEEQKCNLKLANNLDIHFGKPEDSEQARALCQIQQLWQADGQTASSHTASTGNAIVDGINALMGTDGLYSMRKNANVHPLAQLVGVGRALIESAIRNTILAGGASVVGLSLKAIDGVSSKLAPATIGFLMMFATIGLSAGFILFYIVPFLPFIYFFFAVGGWLKAIFEAMVGAPLWALAHIRIDGHGLPGQAAVNGYYLIFEIFIRPILIVFGLLASISIFSALVATLNQTWGLVTSNLGGFDATTEVSGTLGSTIQFMRGPIDEFFYTVVYAIIVYLVAMSSFKLIDLIPNNILRWMGQSVMTFNDQREDPAQGMVGTASVGAQQGISNIGGSVGDSLKKLAG